MEFEARHRFARISPRKARLVMDLIRGRDVDDAITLLRFSKQRASGMIEKVIRSAVANASEQDVPIGQEVREVQRDAHKTRWARCWPAAAP